VKLKNAVEALDIDDPKYDFILVSFVDKPPEYRRKIPTRDRFLQVEIGYDSSIWNPSTPIRERLANVGESLVAIVDRYDLCDDAKSLIREEILRWSVTA